MVYLKAYYNSCRRFSKSETRNLRCHFPDIILIGHEKFSTKKTRHYIVDNKKKRLLKVSKFLASLLIFPLHENPLGLDNGYKIDKFSNQTRAPQIKNVNPLLNSVFMFLAVRKSE